MLNFHLTPIIYLYLFVAEIFILCHFLRPSTGLLFLEGDGFCTNTSANCDLNGLIKIAVNRRNIVSHCILGFF